MMQTKSLEEYGKMVEGKKCRFCGKELPTKIDHYDHDDGWLVEGFEKKQWLSVFCSKCNHDWSLWKLEVPR